MSFGIKQRAILVRIDVSEEHVASIFRVMTGFFGPTEETHFI
jgi:hypothetical protein